MPLSICPVSPGNGQLSQLHVNKEPFISVLKRSVSIKIHYLLVEVYFKSEKVLVSVLSLNIIELSPFGGSSPLFVRNGHSDTRTFSYTEILKFLSVIEIVRSDLVYFLFFSARPRAAEYTIGICKETTKKLNISK